MEEKGGVNNTTVCSGRFQKFIVALQAPKRPKIATVAHPENVSLKETDGQINTLTHNNENMEWERS